MKKFIFFFFLLTTTISAQLNISMSTDKDSYEYGETIRLYCKITNPADTTYEFLAGNNTSCQAEFTFNDFNSWEHTACLTTSELLTFKPHASKIYSWKIDPISIGLPNKEGTQTIIGYYYFDLIDTVYIKAPKFIGGEVSVAFNGSNIDIINPIREGLNAYVIFGDHFGDVKSEIWQIQGYDLDSLVQIYSNDSNFVYFEKSVSIGYETIVAENPIEYYPLQIGNKWYYTFEGQTYDTDPVPYSYQEKWETVGDTLMPNNKNYFISKRFSNPRDTIYERIDSNNCKVYGYYEDEKLDNNEYLVADLKFPKGSELNEKLHFYSNPIFITYTRDTLMYITSFEFKKEKTRHYFAVGGTYGNCHLTKNVGISRYYYEFDFGYRNWTLDYAVVNGKTYGDSTVVSIKNNSQQIPNNFTLSQNYPNPFNPTTTINYTIPNVASGFSLRKVVLKVYDILGKEITTLVNEEQNFGSYETVFDASNLASGIYYYQLIVSDFIETKKMIFLK